MDDIVNNKSQILLIIILLIFSFAGTCDHTELTGKIILNKEIIHVGDEISLELKIPKDLDEIYGIYWDINPKDIGEIIYTERGVDALQNINGGYKVVYKDDRKANFIPLKSGKCVIEVSGYYKQTNPQPITSITLNIIN